VHIKENAKNFHRFEAVWTPTVLVMDPDGNERWRLEGYLPTGEFRVNLEMGLARVAYMKKDLADAERRYGEIVERYPDSKFAPEAVYWEGVSRYSRSHDHNTLSDVARTFTEKYKDSIWAKKSRPWLH
jgi:outer membrane protein assembly factor BamD (BamD/ComL family)